MSNIVLTLATTVDNLPEKVNKGQQNKYLFVYSWNCTKGVHYQRVGRLSM